MKKKNGYEKVRDFPNSGFLDNLCVFMLLSELWVSKEEILSTKLNEDWAVGKRRVPGGNFTGGLIISGNS